MIKTSTSCIGCLRLGNGSIGGLGDRNQARRRGGSGGSDEPPLKFYSSERTPFVANEPPPPGNTREAGRFLKNRYICWLLLGQKKWTAFGGAIRPSEMERRRMVTERVFMVFGGNSFFFFSWVALLPVRYRAVRSAGFSFHWAVVIWFSYYAFKQNTPL